MYLHTLHVQKENHIQLSQIKCNFKINMPFATRKDVLWSLQWWSQWKSECVCECLLVLLQTRITSSSLFCLLVCADNNHVRTWTVTRFRGMISTQPGSTPLASFKILSLEETESPGSYSSGNDIGERGRLSQPVWPGQSVNSSRNLEVRLKLWNPFKTDLVHISKG